jgi:hypothetical protein
VKDLQIKRVAKIEDPLPLLEFSAVDGIVVPGSMLARLIERTRLAIKTKEVSGAPVDLAKLDAPTRHLLGIDSWSVP